MVRPESELAEIAVHVFSADVNVRRGNRPLEQTPETFHVVRVVPSVVPVVEIFPLDVIVAFPFTVTVLLAFTLPVFKVELRDDKTVVTF